MTLSGPIPVLVMVCVFSAGVVLGVTGFGSRAVLSRTDHGRLRSAFQEGGSEMTTVGHKVRWVVLTGALLGSAVWVLLGLGPARKPDKEAPSPSSGTEEREPPPRYCGWIPDPQAVRECLEKMGMGEFRATPKRAEDPGSHLDEPVYLWETVRRVTGEVLPGRDQGTVGSCVQSLRPPPWNICSVYRSRREKRPATVMSPVRSSTVVLASRSGAAVSEGMARLEPGRPGGSKTMVLYQETYIIVMIYASITSNCAASWDAAVFLRN